MAPKCEGADGAGTVEPQCQALAVPKLIHLLTDFA